VFEPALPSAEYTGLVVQVDLMQGQTVTLLTLSTGLM
jgi:hypothetical protein